MLFNEIKYMVHFRNIFIHDGCNFKRAIAKSKLQLAEDLNYTEELIS